MDFKRLHYFCTIVEQGQISRAARVLNMSQPPLSQRLSELEEELGTQLILREGHQWRVTDIGRILYEQSRQILDRLSGLSSEIRELAEGDCGMIRIGASSTYASAFLKVFPRVRQAFPKLRFRILVNDSTELAASVRERELDLALVLLPVDAADFRIYPLPTSDFSVILPRSLARVDLGPVIRVEDLAGLPLICSRRWTGGGTFDQLLGAFQSLNLEPDIVMDTPSTWAGLKALLLGAEAAAVFPTREIPLELFPDHLVLPLDLPAMALHPALVHLESRILSKACQRVVDLILEGSASA